MTEAIHLQLLLATFAGWVTRQQTQVITFLIKENRILKQLVGRRRSLRLMDDQRRRLAAKGKPLRREV